MVARGAGREGAMPCVEGSQEAQSTPRATSVSLGPSFKCVADTDCTLLRLSASHCALLARSSPQVRPPQPAPVRLTSHYPSRPIQSTTSPHSPRPGPAQRTSPHSTQPTSRHPTSPNSSHLPSEPHTSPAYPSFTSLHPCESTYARCECSSSNAYYLLLATCYLLLATCY